VPSRTPSGRATEVSLRHPRRRRTLGDVRDRHGLRRALTTLLVAAVVVVAAPAGAAVREGSCTGPSHWRLRVVPHGGELRVRLAVRGGQAGQRWNIFMDHNGTGFFAGSRISGVEGAWVVRKRVRNLAGTDSIRFGAHNLVTGETCSGRLRRGAVA
jgi:hypothetical protein